MTNITLSIADSIYRRMHQYSEIKWSEYVRKMIEKRLNALDLLEKVKDKDSLFTMFASEQVLRKEWDNEADERWNDV